jgi:hypothetical protein
MPDCVPERLDDPYIEGGVREQGHNSLVVLGHDEQLRVGVDRPADTSMDDLDALVVMFR